MQTVNHVKQIGRVGDLDAQSGGYLTQNIVKGAGLAKHQGQCAICKHPALEEINDKIVNLTLTEAEIKAYGFKMSTVINHRNALKLWMPWKDSASMLLFRQAVIQNAEDTPAYLKMQLLEMYVKIAGLYKAVDNTSNIERTAQLLNMIMPKATKQIDTNVIDVTNSNSNTSK